MLISIKHWVTKRLQETTGLRVPRSPQGEEELLPTPREENSPGPARDLPGTLSGLLGDRGGGGASGSSRAVWLLHERRQTQQGRPRTGDGLAAETRPGGARRAGAAALCSRPARRKTGREARRRQLPNTTSLPSPMATARARPLPALAGRHTRRGLAGDVTAAGGGAVRRRVRGGASGWLVSGRVQSAVRRMARPEAEAEIHPLKAREAPASPGTEARDAEKEAGGGAQPERLSQWRTAAFFLSLYLCLGLAFAFSFVIPCPVRPASRTAWSRAYDDAGEGGRAGGLARRRSRPRRPREARASFLFLPLPLPLALSQRRTPSWRRGTPTGTKCKTCSWPSRPAPAAGTPAAPAMALAPEEVTRGGIGAWGAGAAAGLTDPRLPLRRLRPALCLPGGAFGH